MQQSTKLECPEVFENLKNQSFAHLAWLAPPKAEDLGLKIVRLSTFGHLREVFLGEPIDDIRHLQRQSEQSRILDKDILVVKPSAQSAAPSDTSSFEEHSGRPFFM